MLWWGILFYKFSELNLDYLQKDFRHEFCFFNGFTYNHHSLKRILCCCWGQIRWPTMLNDETIFFSFDWKAMNALPHLWSSPMRGFHIEYYYTWKPHIHRVQFNNSSWFRFVYFTILVEVFTNHIVPENTYFANHIAYRVNRTQNYGLKTCK